MSPILNRFDKIKEVLNLLCDECYDAISYLAGNDDKFIAQFNRKLKIIIKKIKKI